MEMGVCLYFICGERQPSFRNSERAGEDNDHLPGPRPNLLQSTKAERSQRPAVGEAVEIVTRLLRDYGRVHLNPRTDSG